MNNNYSKGFNIDNNTRLNKIANEYFNPYGYSFEFFRKNEKKDYNLTHTNQNNKKK